MPLLYQKIQKGHFFEFVTKTILTGPAAYGRFVRSADSAHGRSASRGSGIKEEQGKQVSKPLP